MKVNKPYNYKDFIAKETEQEVIKKESENCVKSKIKEDAKEKAYKEAGHNAYFGNGFDAGVKFATRWIPIEEDLPTIDGRYLVRGKSNVEYLSYFNPTTKEWSSKANIKEWRYINF